MFRSDLQVTETSNTHLYELPPLEPQNNPKGVKEMKILEICPESMNQFYQKDFYRSMSITSKQQQ